MQKQNIGNKNDIDFQKAANEINKKNFERNEQSLVSTKSQDAESKILRLETPVSMDKRSGRGHTKNYVRKYPNNIDKETLKNITKIPLYHSPTLDQAINISKIFNIPLHSEYTDYWRLISFQDLELLVEHLNQATYNKENNTISIKYSEENKKCKEILENIGVPHNTITTPTTNAKTESNTKEDQTPIIKNIIIPKTQTNILKFLLNIQNIPNEENKINIQIKEGEYEDALDYFEQNLNIKIKDKAGTFIGARMGRPEKAKMRAMQGRPHMLFPVGEEGGRLRSIQGALKVGYIKSQFNKDWLHKLQEDYGEDIIKVLFNKADEHALVELNIKKLLPKVLKELDMTIYPDLIKGVRGVSNKAKMPENIIKGIYRAKYDIAVNKDGTTRYDATELPLTHFKPKEIETGIEKLKELGYTKDIKGQPLTNDNQLLELLPQDIILPQYEAIEKGCGTIMTNVAKFIDEILVKVYKLPPFYNVKKKEDLVGHLVIGLAPHISAGTVGRIIGFSQTQSILTHPMYHAGLRRDCVHPDTKFLYKTTHNNNNNIHNKEIGPLVENLIKKGQKTSIIDSVGTIKVECDKPYTVFGADPKTKKIVEKKVKYFIKGPSPKYWIKTTLGTRRKVIMTPEHNCLVSNNGKLTKKKAKNLKIGDKIPLALNIPEQKNYKNKLNIIEEFVKHLPNKELSNISIRHEAFFRSLVKEKRDLVKPNVTKKHYQKHLLSEWTKKASLLDIKNLLRNNIISLKDLKEAKLQVKFSKRLFSPEIKLTKDFASLLGYYAAEGYCRKSSTVSQVAFRICEKDLQDEIIRLINSVFNITPNLGEGNTKITICDQLVYNFFKYVLDMGCTAYHKKTPPILWNLKKETMIHFLSAYLDGDGTVDVSRNSVQFYSVSRNLLDGVATQFARFSVFSKYFTTKERLPGKTVLERYNELGKEPKKHVLHHLIITGKDTKTLKKILKLKSKRKRDILSKIKGSNYRRTVCNNKRPIVEVEKDLAYDYIREIEKIEDKQNSYCISVEGESKNTKNFIINSLILSSNCDGDEAAILLLLDGLLNFSKKYLPSSRGSTMDAALVLTAILNPAEVDDQVLGMDVHWEYPLELYEAAEKMLAPWEVKWGKDQKKIEQLDHRLGTVKQYEDFGFTHHIDDFNDGVKCSAYKTLPGMREKLKGQMKLGKKIRAVDENQVARLVIQKHFLADIKGNFRKYSM